MLQTLLKLYTASGEAVTMIEQYLDQAEDIQDHTGLRLTGLMRRLSQDRISYASVIRMVE